MKKKLLAGLASALLVPAGVLASTGAAHAATWTCTVTTNSACDVGSTGVSAGSNQSTYVEQDEWAANGVPQFKSEELDANSPGDWQVQANIGSDQYAVLSYPDVQDTVTNTNNEPVPLTDYSTIASTYSTSIPSDSGTVGASDDYEAAYDLWLGNDTEQSWTNDQEIMVWTDNHNQTPAGSDTGKTYTAPDGSVYEIWTDAFDGGVSTGADNIITLVRTQNATTGSLDVMSLFKWLQSNGYTSANAGVDQMDYGFELCSTSGALEDFKVNGYTLTATGDGENGAPSGGGTTPPPPPPSQSAPAATSAAATGVTSTGATLNGSVNPEGADTSYKFDYGTSASYGSSTTAADAGSGTSAVSESAALTGLQPSTKYDYRVEATNSAGTTDGANETFTTPATVTPPPPPPAGPVLSAGTAVSGASWKSTVEPGSWKVTVSGSGKLNGTSETVTEPDVFYPDSSLSKGSTYTVTVQQLLNGVAAGKSGKITFVAG